MKALILAAGRGSRMKRYTDDRPKGLVTLCGCSLVERMITALNIAGIHDIALVTGYKKERYDFLNLPGFHNSDWMNTNMVSSLACAKKWLQAGTTLVCYSDIFVSPAILKKLIQSSSYDLAITYDLDWLSLWGERNDDVLEDAESFRLDNDLIIEIGNTAESVEEIEGQYMGLIKLNPRSWQSIEMLLESLPDKQIAALSMTELFQLLIERNYPVYGVPIFGEWGEVDTEEDLRLYEKYASQNHYGNWFSDTSKYGNT